MTRKTTPIFNAKKVSNNAAELTIYAPIEDEESWWYDSVSPKGVMNALKRMGNVDEILVRINSPGGSVFAGMAIYQYLSDHKAHITVKVDGLAASAASVIMLAGDTIIMGAGAMVMIHNPWTVAMGEAKDFRAAADLLDKVQASCINVYKDRTGKDEEQLKTMLDATTWMTADEAVEIGFADEVDRKAKVSASIKNGIATFGSQRFDMRAFASIPVLPEDTADENQDDEPAIEPPLASGEGEEDVKDLAELKAKHPDIFKAAQTEGIQAERLRITELQALANAPGAADIVSKAIESGGTAAQAAMDIVKASMERVTATGQNRQADSQASGAHEVPADEAPDAQQTAQAKAQAEINKEADALADEVKNQMSLKGGRKNA
ncbi:head maturation protease, ClpP-related [Paenibacillus daejeonensis]|uniref:head maturation protease, ClpP-related n=1 Tax=Paenibacillus daejeonensis TaxID=135193 RepID=UPI00146A050D|nr:head maturation protease, ClpP-related [Paenibacillus daejeonensis]